MRLYGQIEKVEPLEDGTVRVHGKASSEAVDDQGEVVQAQAMRDALPEYMKFPAIREMHQLSAAGTALEAEVGDDNVTRIVAHVIDPVAVSKVKHQVYRGFSIGGRVTKRDSANPKTITGLVLNEISLVDRPANPEAVFDVWKATPTMPEPARTPMQIWACGNPEHKHTAKSAAVKCIEQQNAAVDTKAATSADAAQAEVDAALAAVDAGDGAWVTVGEKTGQATFTPPVDKAAAQPDPNSEADCQPVAKADKPTGDYGSVHYADPGYQADKKPRYPVDSERHIRAAWNYIHKPDNAAQYSAQQLSHIRSAIVAAWKNKIDSAGPPSATDKAALTELLRLTIAEEFADILDGLEIDEPMALAAAVLNPQSAEALVTTDVSKIGKRHNAEDQALLDAAGYAINRAIGVPGARGPIGHLVDAHKAVLDSGATNVGGEGRAMMDGSSSPAATGGTTHATTDTGHNARTSTPNQTGAVPASPHPGEATHGKALAVEDLRKTSAADLIAYVEGIEKRGGGRAQLCQAAHDMICCASDGGTCKDDMPKPARHNNMDWGNFHKCHGHLMQAGGIQCGAPADADKAADAAPGDDTSDKAAGADDLTKAVTDTVAKTVIDALLGRLDKMDAAIAATAELTQKIADTPQPATAIAMVPAQLQSTAAKTTLDPQVIADNLTALNREDPEGATLAMIKAARARPMVKHGFTDGPAPVPQRRPPQT